MAAKSQALSDCLACHGADSRLKSGVVLASCTPGGVAPVWKGETPVPGLIEMQAGGKVVLKPQPGVSQNLHVFGLTSKDWTDRLGLLMLVGVVLTVALHAGFRIAGRRGRNLHASGNAVEMETGDERAVRPERIARSAPSAASVIVYVRIWLTARTPRAITYRTITGAKDAVLAPRNAQLTPSQ